MNMLQLASRTCTQAYSRPKLEHRVKQNRRQCRVQSNNVPSPVPPRNEHPIDISVGGQTATQPGAWYELLRILNEKGVTLLPPRQVSVCREDGEVIIDVRPANEFKEGFILGAENVALFRLIEGWGQMAAFRKIGFALFGVANGTEPNPHFIEEVEALADKDQGIVLVCNLGGDLDPPTKERPRAGVQSRSLIAAYELVRSGFTNVKILRRGMNGWIEDERDVYEAGVEVSDDESGDEA